MGLIDVEKNYENMTCLYTCIVSNDANMFEKGWRTDPKVYIFHVFSSISFDKFHHQSCCAMNFLFKRFQSPGPPSDFSTTLGLGVCHLGPFPLGMTKELESSAKYWTATGPPLPPVDFPTHSRVAEMRFFGLKTPSYVSYSTGFDCV